MHEFRPCRSCGYFARLYSGSGECRLHVRMVGRGDDLIEQRRRVREDDSCEDHAPLRLEIDHSNGEQA